jgi:hypothetical protein
MVVVRCVEPGRVPNDLQLRHRLLDWPLYPSGRGRSAHLGGSPLAASSRGIGLRGRDCSDRPSRGCCHGIGALRDSPARLRAATSPPPSASIPARLLLAESELSPPPRVSAQGVELTSSRLGRKGDLTQVLRCEECRSVSEDARDWIAISSRKRRSRALRPTSSLTPLRGARVLSAATQPLHLTLRLTATVVAAVARKH